MTILRCKTARGKKGNDEKKEKEKDGNNMEEALASEFTWTLEQERPAAIRESSGKEQRSALPQKTCYQN